MKDKYGFLLCLGKSHNGSVYLLNRDVYGIDNCQLKHSKLVLGCSISRVGCYAQTSASVNTPGDSEETLSFWYSISSMKGRGALKIFEVLGVALFRGRRLLEDGALFKFFISYFLKTREIKKQPMNLTTVLLIFRHYLLLII